MLNHTAAAHCGRAHLVGFASKGIPPAARRNNDFRFAWWLYEELMKAMTIELVGRWNKAGQKQVVELALTYPGTFIIVKDDLDAAGCM
jgi:hypothetical protein